MNNYESTIESFIDFCDDMKITTENLKSSLKEGKKNKKEIKDKVEMIKKMPESSPNEIENKLNSIKDARNEICSMIKELKNASPDIVERIIGFISALTGTVIQGVCILYGIKNIKCIGGTISAVSLLSFIASPIIGASATKFTVHGKISDIKAIISILKMRDKELELMEKTLSK